MSTLKERAASDRRLQHAAGRNFCRVCDKPQLPDEDNPIRFAPKIEGGPFCCSSECARAAHVADAIDRLIDTLEEGGALIEVSILREDI